MKQSQNVETQFFHYHPSDGFRLQSGKTLPEYTLAYESYGTLNAKRDNAILLFHAMTGSQHAAGYNPAVEAAAPYWTEECHIGWWDSFIGPGKALNTDRFFILCCNYLGSCYGSTGPESKNPATGQSYGVEFPVVTISDVVDSQLHLLDHLNISRLHAAIGPSTGGFMALDLAVRHPEKVNIVIPIAASIGASTLQRLYIFEQMCAIENCPSDHGLSLARMIAHKTFVSLHTIRARSRGTVSSSSPRFIFHQVDNAEESYMSYQGQKFTRRFSPLSYLLMLELWFHFHLSPKDEQHPAEQIFLSCQHQQYLLFSISSDVCFYPDEQEQLHELLKKAHVPATYITVHSDKGHDSFLLEPDLYTPYLRHILEQSGR